MLIMNVIQNIFDWLIKLKKEKLYMPQPRYQICHQGIVIRTLLSDLEVYASNKLEYLHKTN